MRSTRSGVLKALPMLVLARTASADGPVPAAPAPPTPDRTAPTRPQDPVRDDLQRQIDELRRLVQEQAREIERLKADRRPAQPAKPPAPPSTATREQAGFYGFARLDVISDSNQTSNAQAPFFVQSPSNGGVRDTSNGTFAMHPRLTRLGWNLAAPADTLKGTRVTGKIEMDFQNAQGVTAESRPVPRLRHGYLQIQRGASTWLLGQTWDLISPLFPSPNDDTLMWNAGNLGDRRPQIRWTHAPAAAPLSFAVALGLTGAIDAKDLDGNGVRDGEDSSMPNIQARVAWKNARTALGFWAHYAEEALSGAFAGQRHMASHSFGLDFAHRFDSRWDLRGEYWAGRNLSDFRGGIGQGVAAATGAEIDSRGGWLELGIQTSPTHRLALGYTEDNPSDGDVAAGGRIKNYAVFLHNRVRLPGNMELGANYLYWLTRWKGLATGIGHRLNAFIQHNF